jgi:DNA uptake protein ComE-like DNA-binding protein
VSVTVTAGGTIRSGPRLTALLVLAALLACLPLGQALAEDQGETDEAREVRLGHKVDLNSAPTEAILGLPIPRDLADNILDYRARISFFDSVYDLMNVEGMTAEFFAVLKPIVSTLPPPEADASLARLSASYRQAQRYLGQEGSNEGLVDEYLDKMRNPENVNSMDLYDLMSYQNVSPVDATNILKARERLGRFESGRQLRRSEGLRYWSYRNLRDFVVYEDDGPETSGNAVNGYAQTRYSNTPYYNGDDDEVTPSDVNFRVNGDYYNPRWLNKIRVNTQDGYSAGVLTNREYAEVNWNEQVKGFVGVQDRNFGSFRLKGAFVGNYRVAYGLGLIMDNTDFIHYRKTGFGFNKRLLGVHGDLSRSYEYKLTGAAAEGTWGPLNASFFVSSEKKDGVVNPDGTLNRYITLRPRPPSEFLDGRLGENGLESGLQRDAIEEEILGGNMKVMLAPGTFIGVTGYEARYNRGWDPTEETLFNEQVLDPNRLPNPEARDSEVWNSYQSYFVDADGNVDEYKFRRVMGAEAQAVYKNVSVQGEYAFVQNPQNSLFNSKNPDAYIINAYSQWENLHLIGIWRDSDVGYDNPYNRAFSNDNRYEMTLMDAPYRLNDDAYTLIESETPQAKPEKGMFLEARYRISRSLILNGLQFDKWTRKADGADMMRYTIKGEYQPIFNLRFRVRHRYSSRSENDPNDVRTFQNWETRFQMITMLSNYNRLQFMYMTSNVHFPARQRLSGTAEPSPLDPGVGTNGSPSRAFEVKYEHQFTPGLKITLASSIYDGFFWNFEGNEFVLLTDNGFRNWFKVESRVSERLLFQLKVTRDHQIPNTYIDIRDFGDVSPPTPDADYAPADQMFVRLQMDYTF